MAGDFNTMGGVPILGFISPFNTGDTYPVIDPLYGIDGFRNVDTVSDMYDIPELRRRAGMVVGVSGGTTYYKLNDSPWSYDSSDWSIFNSGGGSSDVITGGTYSAGTLVLTSSTGGSISISGFYTGSTDVFVTGGTYSNGTATFRNNTGGTFSINGFYTGSTSAFDVFVTGGTYSNGTAIFTNNTGGTFNINGFYTGGTDIYTTGVTYNNSNLTFYRNDGNTYGVTLTGVTSGGQAITSFTYNNNTFYIGISGSSSYNAVINSVTGLTSSGLLSSQSLSATTYYNLPLDIRVTGGTYSNGTAIFTNNTGGTFTVTGFSTGGTSGFDVFVTGGTYSNGNATFRNNTGGTFSVSGFSTTTADTYVTAATFSSTTLLIYQNQNQPAIQANIDSIQLSGVMSSVTFDIRTSGILSGNTIHGNTVSATTYYNLPLDIRVTGGTYSNGTAIFTNNTGGTFNINGFYTGGTDVFVTGGTYSNGTAIFTNNTGGTFNVSGFSTTTADTYVTGITYSNNNIILSRSGLLPDISANIDSFTSMTINGLVDINSLSGSTDRILQIDSGGTVTAFTEIISAYLVSTGATASILDTASNWSPSGQYTGTTITNTYQGQKHYNSSYFYEAVADNVWIRLLRG